MSYLDELPRCPTCKRILRTRNDRPWCATCHHYADDIEPKL